MPACWIGGTTFRLKLMLDQSLFLISQHQAKVTCSGYYSKPFRLEIAEHHALVSRTGICFGPYKLNECMYRCLILQGLMLEVGKAESKHVSSRMPIMADSVQATANLPDHGSVRQPSLMEGFGLRKLGIVVLCAVGCSLACIVIYNSTAKPRAADAYVGKDDPAVNYLISMRDPPIDYAHVSQAPFDFNEAGRASKSAPFTKGDQCWKTYDATPSWSQYDYCVAYDKVIRSHASSLQVKGHAKQSGYPSAIERKGMRFLVGKSAALKGQHIAFQRANDVQAAVRIDRR